MTADDLRARWEEFHQLPAETQAIINRTRWFTVGETTVMFERAIAENWYGNGESLEPDVKLAIVRDLQSTGHSERVIAIRHDVSRPTVRSIRLALAA